MVVRPIAGLSVRVVRATMPTIAVSSSMRMRFAAMKKTAEQNDPSAAASAAREPRRRGPDVGDAVGGRAAGESGRDAGASKPGVGTHDVAAVQVAAQPVAQPAPGDTDADGVGQPVGGRHADHGPRAGSSDVAERGGGGVDGGDDHRVVEGGAGVLVGVEAAQHDVLHGVRDQAEAEGHQDVAHGLRGLACREEPNSRVHIGMPSARKPKATGTMATAELRRPCEMSSRTAPASPSCGGAGDPGQQRGHHRDGDDRLRHAPDQLGVGVGDDSRCRVPVATPCPPQVASWVTTSTPAWLARTNRTVHLASLTALPRPWPRQSKRGRKRKPASRRYGNHGQGLDGQAQQGADAQQPDALRAGWS